MVDVKLLFRTFIKLYLYESRFVRVLTRIIKPFNAKFTTNICVFLAMQILIT